MPDRKVFRVSRVSAVMLAPKVIRDAKVRKEMRAPRDRQAPRDRLGLRVRTAKTASRDRKVPLARTVQRLLRLCLRTEHSVGQMIRNCQIQNL